MNRFLEFLLERGGIIDWLELPEEFTSLILDACRQGLIESFCETESYQITQKGTDFIRLDKISRL